MTPVFRTHIAALTIAVFLLMAPAAQAIVETIDATVTAQVKEFVDQQEVNTDYGFEDLTETTGTFPLIAEARLGRPEDSENDQMDGEDASGAFATTSFHDPRLSQVPDPDEFGIGVSAFSTLSNISYAGQSSSTETRDVSFLESELGQPPGTLLEARSHFFLDGILIVWGEQGNDDLSGTSARVVLSVEQKRLPNIDEPGPKTVLQATLTLDGQSDGTLSVSATGDLVVDNVTVLDLTDPESDLGPIHMVVIPDIAIPYIYSAEVDEEFTLTAEIAGAVENRPGTGASVELGVPLLELAGLISEVAGEGLGDRFDEFLDSMLASSPPPPKPLPRDSAGTVITVVGKQNNLLFSPMSLPMCGGMAIELPMLLVFFATASTISSRRRR